MRQPTLIGRLSTCRQLSRGPADLALVIDTAETPSTAEECFDQQPLLDEPS
ncbi:hypothetical protein FHR84_003773 [Actinopolyspora biskrensis]|uniref:Uncharacterized protein n=1 Tax=Actinopolyspora biskrensis TaxID=1470178 RepID=A0A852ZA59_9ACTN|nr:hypothetical protein [Actinopolyspora biskrensis]NYH80416.1 hypothetical protein [Actinopolyspora biskrensis]